MADGYYSMHLVPLSSFVSLQFHRICSFVLGTFDSLGFKIFVSVLAYTLPCSNSAFEKVLRLSEAAHFFPKLYPRT